MNCARIYRGYQPHCLCLRYIRKEIRQGILIEVVDDLGEGYIDPVCCRGAESEPEDLLENGFVGFVLVAGAEILEVRPGDGNVVVEEDVPETELFTEVGYRAGGCVEAGEVLGVVGEGEDTALVRLGLGLGGVRGSAYNALSLRVLDGPSSTKEGRASKSPSLKLYNSTFEPSR